MAFYHCIHKRSEPINGNIHYVCIVGIYNNNLFLLNGSFTFLPMTTAKFISNFWTSGLPQQHFDQESILCIWWNHYLFNVRISGAFVPRKRSQNIGFTSMNKTQVTDNYLCLGKLLTKSLWNLQIKRQDFTFIYIYILIQVPEYSMFLEKRSFKSCKRN